MMKRIILCALIMLPEISSAADCNMKETRVSYFLDAAKTKLARTQKAHVLNDGSVLFKSRMHINFDGSRKAYHKNNIKGGAILNLCNAATVYLPEDRSYVGSESNETCTGKFLRDYRAIAKSGWHDPSVGLINWYGVLGKDNVRIGNRIVKNVEPIEQKDGSGFFISPTSLVDKDVDDPEDVRRYIDPTNVAGAVVRDPKLVSHLPIDAGSFGVAYNPKKGKAVPFIVGDFGPRVGEATPFLARQVQGIDEKTPYDRNNRAVGGVDAEEIVWIFFRKERMTAGLDSRKIAENAKNAYENWGGQQKLSACVDEM